jgi:hypothetical protein
MSHPVRPTCAGEAVRQFADDLARRAPISLRRIQVRLDGPGGLSRLCQVEDLVRRLSPQDAKREFVWLAGAGRDYDTLELSAYDDSGALVCEAAHRLALEPG